MPNSRRWHFVEHFFVRRTGFPYEYIEKLQFKNSLKITSHLYKLQLEQDKLLAQFDACILPVLAQHVRKKNLAVNDGRQIYNVRKLAEKRMSIDINKLPNEALDVTDFSGWLKNWNQIAHNSQALITEGYEIFNHELSSARRELKDIAQEPSFQEALLLSSPEVYSNINNSFLPKWNPNIRNNKVRWWERLLVSYLQRFCAKNEATSFFGPSEFAAADWCGKENIKYSWDSYHKETFFAYWGAAILAKKISLDSKFWYHLKPRREPLCEYVNDEYFLVHWVSRKYPVQDIERKIYNLCTGQMDIVDISRYLKRPLEEISELVKKLTLKKVLRTKIEIPAQEKRPLRWLKKHLKTQFVKTESVDRWLELLIKLDTYRKMFQQATLEEKLEVLKKTDHLFKENTGVEPRRGQGRFYMDRMLLYEECYESLKQFRLGSSLLTDLEESIQPILDSLAIRGLLYRDFLLKLGLQIYTETFGNRESVNYADFIRAVRKVEEKLKIEQAKGKEASHKTVTHQNLLKSIFPADATTLDTWENRIEDIIKKKQSLFSDRMVSLTAADLSWQDRRLLENETLYTSPDFMIAAKNIESINAGDYKIIMNEVHDSLQLMQAIMLPSPGVNDAFRQMRDGLLGMPTYDQLAFLIPDRFHRNFIVEYPCPSIELFTSSVKDPSDTIPFSSLRVSKSEEGVKLFRKGAKHSMQLTHGGQDDLHIAMFVCSSVRYFPMDSGKHSQRIEIENVVYQRERWIFEGHEILAAVGNQVGFVLFKRCNHFREKHGIPVHTFIRASGELKPIYLDWSNFFLLELLVSLAKKNDTLVFTEMLPSPDEYWLQNEHGRFTCEFRGCCIFTEEPMSERGRAIGIQIDNTK